MSRSTPQPYRILALSLTTKGLGYAVMEGKDSLIAYGCNTVSGNKNVRSLVKAEKLMNFYRPDVLVLPDVNAKDAHRAPRIRTLHRQIVEAAGKRKFKVSQFSGKQLRIALLGNARGTKHEMAQMLAERFPDELASRLPPKRREWMSEDSRMGMFEAVALTTGFRSKKVDQKN